MNTVLIVDDHSDIRRLLSITLGREFKVLEAEDGVSGLALARQHQPKVVLLDVMMPGDMDGLQVLDAIKSDPAMCNTLVAMITARGQVADHDDARARGADAYFIKPFSPLQVASWVRNHCKEVAVQFVGSNPEHLTCPPRFSIATALSRYRGWLPLYCWD